MSQKISITLDDEILEFVDQGIGNRSSFINAILWQEKKRLLRKGLAEAYTDQSNDLEFHQELLVWDATVGDGLDI